MSEAHPKSPLPPCATAAAALLWKVVTYELLHERKTQDVIPKFQVSSLVQNKETLKALKPPFFFVHPIFSEKLGGHKHNNFTVVPELIVRVLLL